MKTPSRPFTLSHEPLEGGGGCECGSKNVLQGLCQKYCNVGGDAERRTLGNCDYEAFITELWSLRGVFVVGGAVRGNNSGVGAGSVEARRGAWRCSEWGRVFSRQWDDEGRMMEAGHAFSSLNLPPIPQGLDPWLVEFIKEAEHETSILRANGAESHATAREAVLRSLLRKATEYMNAEIGVTQAAEILGQCEETVRRAIRSGLLPDKRAKPRGHHRTLRGDVLSLARGRAKKYDPVADAQDIAKLRRAG